MTREATLELGLSDESIMHLAQQPVASGTSPSRNVIRDELRCRVRRALAQLKDSDREVVILRYLEHLSSKEIAAIVGTTESAVNMRHVRALRRLHSLLSSPPDA